MMASLNRATLRGYLGSEPELHVSESGARVVKFGLATTERWRHSGGEQRTRTQWHKVVVINEVLTEIAMAHLAKGSKVSIEGTIEYRSFKDRAGTEHWITEVVLGAKGARLDLLESKAEREARQEASRLRADHQDAAA